MKIKQGRDMGLRYKCVVLVGLLGLGMLTLLASADDPVSYVLPRMGTDCEFKLSSGNVYPAIARPWGMNFWTPQTGKIGNGWTYGYDAYQIVGIKQTHRSSPWINDYGQFSIMPITSKAGFNLKALCEPVGKCKC